MPELLRGVVYGLQGSDIMLPAVPTWCTKHTRMSICMRLKHSNTYKVNCYLIMDGKINYVRYGATQTYETLDRYSGQIRPCYACGLFVYKEIRLKQIAARLMQANKGMILIVIKVLCYSQVRR